MRTRILLAALVWLLAPGSVLFPPAPCAAKPGPPFPAFLSLDSLRGSMQGQSGIVLDLNGDGLEDLVVGAPRAHGRGGANGALLVYLAQRAICGPTGSYSARPSILWEGDGNLGWSLAALGDVDGDGKADFAAGAISGSSEEVSLAGTVTIYRGGDRPRNLSILSGENALDKFGYALATGDLNGDGIPDLIAGAPFHSPSPDLYQKGAVYVFFGPGYDPGSAVKIPATPANGGLGFSLAAGDINGDGVDDLLLQASGKVIAYYGAKGSFIPDPAGPEAVFSGPDAGFGRAINVLWDLDGDGFKDIGVGADQAIIANVADSGRLYLLKGGSGKRLVNLSAPSPDLLAKIDGEPNCGRFASALLALGDMDGDGAPDLAVSAVHADGEPWLMTGKIFLFSGPALTAGATVADARAIPGNARDMHLGAFLAPVAKGTRLAAGAPTEDANTGKVRFYNLR